MRPNLPKFDLALFVLVPQTVAQFLSTFPCTIGKHRCMLHKGWQSKRLCSGTGSKMWVRHIVQDRIQDVHFSDCVSYLCTVPAGPQRGPFVSPGAVRPFLFQFWLWFATPAGVHTGTVCAL